MSERFYVLMMASNSANTEREYTKFECFHEVQEAVDMVQHWLSFVCGLDCVPASEEARLRAENDGEIPDGTFLCPEVKVPADLVQYNGYHEYYGIGMCSLFLTPVYDHDTAQRFRAGMNKEYGIDQVYTDEADRLWELLSTFVASFDDESVDPTEAETAIRDFLLRGGFSLFDTAAYAPEYMVLPDGGKGQFEGF